MKYKTLLPLLALVLHGCEALSLDPSMDFSYNSPTVPDPTVPDPRYGMPSSTVECGDMLRDRLYFVDAIYRDAWPIRNRLLDRVMRVPRLTRVEVYIEDTDGILFSLCNPDGTVSPENRAVPMRSLRNAGDTGNTGVILRPFEGVLELTADIPLDRALAVAWRGTDPDGTTGTGRGVFLSNATEGDTLVLLRRPTANGNAIAPLELLHVYDLGPRAEPDIRPIVKVCSGEDDTRCHEGIPLATLFYLDAPTRVYSGCEADWAECPFLDEQGWLWFPSLKPFSAGVDARPRRGGTTDDPVGMLDNSPHSGYLPPPHAEELGRLYTLRPGDPGYARLSATYRIVVIM